MTTQRTVSRFTSLIVLLSCIIFEPIAQSSYTIPGTFPDQPLDAFLWVWEIPQKYNVCKVPFSIRKGETKHFRTPVLLSKGSKIVVKMI